MHRLIALPFRVVPAAAQLGRTLKPFSTTNAENKVALIVGAGDSTGSAIARAFSREGYHVAAVRRNADKLSPLVEEIQGMGAEITGFGVDCRKEEKVVELVDKIERDIGPIHCAVFNVGANVRFGIRETTSRVYFKVWEMACFSGFLVGREVSTRMRKRGQGGTIIFTGATASLRGGTGFAAFSSAKAALRALAQSMARELGVEGIHVAHVVIDGGIDTPWLLENMPGAEELKRKGGLLNPDDIALNYVQLHKQPRSAWTHELDLRPFCEKW